LSCGAIKTLMNCAIDVGNLPVLMAQSQDLDSLLVACYRAGRECAMEPRTSINPMDCEVTNQPADLTALPVEVRWVWHTLLGPFVDIDLSLSHWGILTFFCAPYGTVATRDVPGTPLWHLATDLVACTVDRGGLFAKRATPDVNNLRSVGQQFGNVWHILVDNAFFTFDRSTFVAEFDAAWSIAFGDESARR
jgi:hypothetical protein